MTLTASDRAYFLLVLSWLLVDLALFLAPAVGIPPGQEIDSSRLLLDVGLAGGGFLALRAAHRVGFAPLWPAEVPLRTRLALPAAAGLLLGGVPAAIDLVAPIGDIHADLPFALLNYYVGAIFSEVMFRLIPVGLLVWALVTYVSGPRWRKQVFWTVALVVGLYEPIVSWQVLSDPGGPIGFESATAALAFVSTAYTLNVSAAYVFWTRGFLAAVVLRGAFYLVWHIAWPLVYY